MLIYHIVLPEAWEKFKDQPFYAHESLESEGFIHCSYRNQLEEVLERYYKNAEKVLILHISPARLDPAAANLIAERSTGGEVYPHIYGKINQAAIVNIEERILR
ncbi:MAG: DUF952 domain-containing protein [Acidobacteriota bacterium]|nr:DUF952 domain-containing protein [Acidobacteriota bacterium]